MKPVHDEAGMTDAIAVLTEGHRRMRSLFEEFEALPVAAYVLKSKVVAQMIDLITVHAFIKSEVLYPRVTELLPEVQDDVDAFRSAHRRAEQVAADLWTMRPEDERFAPSASELIERVRDHLDAQEDQWFPRLADALDPPALHRIGVELIRARRRAPASPRPG